MDIQKIKELALANGFKLKEQASGNIDLNAYVYDFANAIEQAAKAQAIPDGFVVVPKEPTERMLDSAYSSISDNLHYADLESIYKAMIWSAQEPANESE